MWCVPKNIWAGTQSELPRKIFCKWIWTFCVFCWKFTMSASVSVSKTEEPMTVVWKRTKDWGATQQECLKGHKWNLFYLRCTCWDCSLPSQPEEPRQAARVLVCVRDAKDTRDAGIPSRQEERAVVKRCTAHGWINAWGPRVACFGSCPDYKLWVCSCLSLHSPEQHFFFPPRRKRVAVSGAVLGNLPQVVVAVRAVSPCRGGFCSREHVVRHI